MNASSDRISIIPINRKNTFKYNNNQINKNDRSVKLYKKKDSKYIKMLSLAKKNSTKIENFQNKIFQGNNNKNKKNLNKIYSSSLKETENESIDQENNFKNKKKLFLKRLNPVKKRDKKFVNKKIQQLCEPIKLKNKEKEEEDKKTFDGLILVSNIKDLISLQKRKFQSKEYSVKNDLNESQNNTDNDFKDFKFEILNKIQLSLYPPKIKLKKKHFEKTKFFRENFIKLALFIKEFNIEKRSLFELIPEKPYNDPDSCNVRYN